MTDKRFAKSFVGGQFFAVMFAACLFAPRAALSDCCNCTFDLGDGMGIVKFCQGNLLDECGSAFNCTDVMAGSCTPENNTIGSSCIPPAPTNTPSQTPTETPTGTPTSTPTITPTPTPVPNGGGCMTDSQCVSGICIDNICQAQNGAPAVSNHNLVFLALALLLGGLWMVSRRLPRRD
jgi:hypothetical protein